KEFLHRTRWLLDLLRRARKAGIEPTHLIVLGSSGPLLLAAAVARALGLPKGSTVFNVLHGANDIFQNWKPRNPLTRLFSFRTAFELLPRIGIKVIALEPFIAQALRTTFPGVGRMILCIPHGFDEEEFPLTRATRTDGTLRVLFLGQATPHKGFAD